MTPEQAQGELAQGERPIWERQENEPARWYARFETFRLLGPSRSIEAGFERDCLAAGLTATRPGRRWYEAARRWRWRERAEAWDEAERERWRATEEQRRDDGHHYRMGLIDEMLATIADVLTTADLRALNTEQARAYLPTLRILLKDLLAAHRIELGVPTWVGVKREDGRVELTVDDLLAARQKLIVPPGAHGGFS